MNYWIFTVTEQKDEKTWVPARGIFNLRMEDRFWGLAEKTPNRKNLSKGDKVVYYIGLPEKVFAGIAVLASPCLELSESQSGKYAHGKEFYTQDYGVLLEDIEKWEKPKSVEELVPQLKFIENKQFWGSYLQGGVRQLTEEDFKTIVGEREVSLIEQIKTTRDIESQSEFALETHLEEFIYLNWVNINWGSRLELYRTDEQNGRQFPAGTWSIDFLALDTDTNDLVVIELKRGKTSDSTVGQLLRYISWIKENVAESNQNVRGIIIAKEVDEALKYAIKNLDHIEVKEYSVDFQLRSFKK